MSLLNVDYKNFVSYQDGYCYGEDQTGFYKQRYIRNSIRRMMNLIELSKSRKDPVVFCFLDAAKAFDRVQWGFLFEVLQRTGFGSCFLHWNRMIYCNQVANIWMGVYRSEQIDILMWVRQVLFNLVIKKLALKISKNTKIHGIHLGENEGQCEFYAAADVCSIRNPTESMSELRKVLDLFGRLSGYLVN